MARSPVRYQRPSAVNELFIASRFCQYSANKPTGRTGVRPTAMSPSWPGWQAVAVAIDDLQIERFAGCYTMPEVGPVHSGEVLLDEHAVHGWRRTQRRDGVLVEIAQHVISGELARGVLCKNRGATNEWTEVAGPGRFAPAGVTAELVARLC